MLVCAKKHILRRDEGDLLGFGRRAVQAGDGGCVLHGSSGLCSLREEEWKGYR